ncbi:MAG: transcriptional repressor [Gemmataceae bacterium]|nr:transcriptional repressor [Gemmataceae bacterium]
MLPNRVPVNQTPEDKFREYLSSRVKPQRYTEQQREMVRYIFGQHEHFDADQLMVDMKAAGLILSRATAYRTLAKLVDAGLLRRLLTGDKTRFEHDYGYPDHDHFHCMKCDKMIEFHLPEVDRILSELAREHGFLASRHNLIVHGTCEQCNKAKTPRRLLDLI